MINGVRSGMRVQVSKLGETTGMLIKPRHLDCRKVGITGVVRSYVPGHGGDVWFVQHDGSDDIGAYCYTELDEVDDSRTTETKNGVRVCSKIVGDACIVAAIYKGKVLNRHVFNGTSMPQSMFDAGAYHRLMIDTWGSASEGNLIDEAQDAPVESASTWDASK